MKLAGPTLVGLSLAFASCASSPNEPESDARTTATAESKQQILRVDGEAVILGQAASPSIPLHIFASRIQQLATAGRDEEIAQIVRTYPDLAEQAVLSAGVSTGLRQTIAAWLDGLASPAQGGWSIFLAHRAQNPSDYADWEEQRAAAWEAMRRGAFGEAADRSISWPDDGPTPWPASDASFVRATAMLADGRPDEAAKLFESAADLTTDWDVRFAARSRLFSSLSHRLAGSSEAASRARASAVASLALDSVQDPVLLRLLLETQEPAQTSSDGFTRRAIRARLGRVELQRGAPEAAVLAWRAAEADPGVDPSRFRLRLGQAEALIALGQEQPAIAMLAGLAQSDVRSEALAMLGLVQMRRGQVDTALAVLREAVESTSSERHPGVYADAGLALLSAGNRDFGLTLLHQARDVYQARGDERELGQLLMNELQYARAVDDSALASEVRQRLLDSKL